MKTCTKCIKTKQLIEFPKDIRYADGRNSWCKTCKNALNREKRYASIWQKNNPEEANAIKNKYVKNNKHTVKNSKAKYAKANPKKILAKVRKYQASKLQATPKWLTKDQIKEMENFYINCPKGYHIDHIIPLQGKTVRGLHVPWNLQYLEASVNRRKSNKVA